MVSGALRKELLNELLNGKVPESAAGVIDPPVAKNGGEPPELHSRLADRLGLWWQGTELLGHHGDVTSRTQAQEKRKQPANNEQPAREQAADERQPARTARL
jgi:hypothetical protein